MPYTATCAVQESVLKRGTSIREKAVELQRAIAKNKAIVNKCQEEIKVAKQRENTAKEEQKRIRELLLDLQVDLERIESKTRRHTERRHSFSRRFEENISIKKELESKAKVDFSKYVEEIKEYNDKVPVLDRKMKEIRIQEDIVLGKIEKAERRVYKAEDKAAVLENKLSFTLVRKDITR